MEAMKLARAAAFLVIGIVLLSLFWSVGSGFVAARWPFWAWRNGTAAMQETAIPEIVSRIRQGEEIAEVIEGLGPGSARGGQDNYVSRSGGEGQVGFGVRSDANTGILVTYRDGKVVKVERYR